MSSTGARRRTTVDHIAAYATAAVTLTGRGEAASIPMAVVTPDIFPLLGVRADRRPRPRSRPTTAHGAERTAVISETLWARSFDARSVDRRAGRRCSTAIPIVIVGVMPAQLRVSVRRRESAADLDAGAGVALLGAVGRPARRVVPEGDRPPARRASRCRRRSPSCRRSPRASMRRTRATAPRGIAGAAVPGRARQELPARADRAARRGRGRAADRVREHREPAAGARHGAAARNRDPHRARREPAPHRPPAARSKASLLAVVGGAAGPCVALWGVDALVRISPVQIPRLNTVHIDRSVLAFTLLASMLTGALCGLAPRAAAVAVESRATRSRTATAAAAAATARARAAAGRRRGRAVADAARLRRPAAPQPRRCCSASARASRPSARSRMQLLLPQTRYSQRRVDDRVLPPAARRDRRASRR